METLRFSDSPELNNAWLVGLAVALLLVIAWCGLVLSSTLFRWAVSASGVSSLEPLSDWIHKRARIAAVALSLLVAVAGAGLLGFTLWRGIDLLPYFDGLWSALTPELMTAIGRSFGLLIALGVGYFTLERASRGLLRKVSQLLQARNLSEEDRVHADRLEGQLPSAINLSIAYATVSLSLEALRLPVGLGWFITTTLYVLMLISAGRALVYFIYVVSGQLMEHKPESGKARLLEEYYLTLRRLLPVGQMSLAAIIHVGVATLIIQRFETLEAFAPYGPVLIRIIAIFFAASLIVEFSGVLISKALAPTLVREDENNRRRSTFVELLQNIAKYIIYFCVSMIVLRDLGVDPTPILAGAGILGLAVGLGAQTLVRDMLNGIFLLFEDQILKGDYIRVNDTEGVVEEITPRVTRIRDRFGRLHILANGEINNVINYSRGWTLAVVEVSVAYEADVDKVLAVLDEVCAQVHADVPERVVDAPKVMGIESLDESWMRVRIEAKVHPGNHFDVKRLLNRMLFDAFLAHDLEIPYPKAIELSGPPFLEPAPDPSEDHAGPKLSNDNLVTKR
ncbi:Potassium efflux system KefA protein / Small-conductance mechanosensitive channel [Enhygromyxa salina]|uniref:Potassium efflux system KefA protein / Small-conductance mechanosensitive channel n=1 Tax=Enhygromyxa salina TaxID=215803 RepID=A0A0C2D6Y7_9BACT|nr:mechanosensitive ion channel family protein [Enhygromyxa salina]KIG18956.1 Potassium efflux system KefA protein / Small-conductance mechanosensitive channel [Enhygromyxa salina]